MTKAQLENLHLQSERLCLDFANTLDWHASAHPIEKLTSYAELVAWARDVGVLTERIARQLMVEANRRPAEATATLDKARTLREAIYGIFVAVSRAETPRQTDVETLNTAIAETLDKSRLVRTSDGFDWTWGGAETDLGQMLWWIVQSATAVMTSDELPRVGQCADEGGCGWLFLDTSKNHSRRWCDMRGCGNRAKAKRHYEKVKSEK
jgi:predicted RNA-binding Zn ribbon-like protein